MYSNIFRAILHLLPSSTAANAGVLLFPDASMTNATFAAAVCERITSEGISNIEIYEVEGRPDIKFELPDCLWDAIDTSGALLRTVTLTSVIIRGNSSGSSDQYGPRATDPFLRFPSRLTSLEISNCVLIDPTTSIYTTDLRAVTVWYRKLAFFTVKDTDLNGAAMFDQAPPSLGSLVFSRLGLTGSISPSLFAALGTDGSSPSVNYDLSFNNLNGTLPYQISFNWDRIPSFVLSLANNQLTGVIAPNFLPRASAGTTFSLDVSSNQLTGGIPTEFLTRETFPGSPSIALNFNDNMMHGVFPAEFLNDVFNQATVPKLTIRFAGNNLIGPAPAFFAELSDTSATTFRGFELDLSNNGLTSVGLGVVPNKTVTMTGPFILDLSSNSLAGTIPVTFVDTNTSTSLDLSNNPQLQFCTAGRIAWDTTHLTFCRLVDTTASNCANLYPSCATGASSSPSTPTGAPSSNPSSPASPSSPTSSPSSPTSTVPSTPSLQESPADQPPTGAAIQGTNVSILLTILAFLLGFVNM